MVGELTLITCNACNTMNSVFYHRFSILNYDEFFIREKLVMNPRRTTLTTRTTTTTTTTAAAVRRRQATSSSNPAKTDNAPPPPPPRHVRARSCRGVSLAPPPYRGTLPLHSTSHHHPVKPPPPPDRTTPLMRARTKERGKHDPLTKKGGTETIFRRIVEYISIGR